MKRISTFITTAVALALVLPGIAQAATGPWSWHDISPRVTYQTQRPVWAVAWSEDGWFYTDGINLWDGGQVYWFDGQTSAIVTLDVRNANIERVDDIVSDRAGTVLFLQDVVRNDNQFRIVMYRNDTYTNVTNTFKSALRSDEGIYQIIGRNGSWYLLTTQKRLFAWNESDALTQITLPSKVRNYSDVSNESLHYSDPKHTEFEGVRGLRFLPYGSSYWLLHATTDIANEEENVYYRFDGSSFTDIDASIPSDFQNATMVNSNGETILFLDSCGSYGNCTKAGFFDGSFHGVVETGLTNPSNASSMTAWNGNSWFFYTLPNKTLYRITESAFASYGETKDYFLTVAGSNDGEFLLGGAASKKGRSTPFSPLSAKLTRVIEDGGVSDSNENGEVVTPATNDNGERVIDEGTGITTWQWLTPNVSEITENEDVTYTVGAWDADSIKRIQIVVNGDVKRTCELSGTSGNVECSHTIAANAYADNTNIFVNAQVWDAGDRYVWTSGKNVYNRADADDDAYVETSNSNTNTGTNTTISFNPNRTSLRNNEHIAVNVEAWDNDGIRRIDFYVNGDVRNSCTWNSLVSNRTCETTLWSSDYNVNTDIYVNAKVTDGDGRVTWTNSRTIRRIGETSNDYNYGDPGDVHITSWFDGDTTLDPGESIIFRTEAWASDGLKQIKVYVDGEPAHTCNYNHALEEVVCNHSIYHQDRADGQVVRAKAQAIDENGRVAWSEEETIRIRTPYDYIPTPNPTDGDLNVWDWLEPNKESIELHETATYHPVAWAQGGVERISVYANGALIRECNYTNGSGNRDCWAELNGADYPVNTNVFVNARVRDANGQIKWTDGKTIRVYDNGTVTDENDNRPGTLNVWSNRDHGITNDQLMTVSANGSDPDGIGSLEIYVNAERVKTCYSASCTVTAGPFNQYPYVTYAAKLTDTNGNATWTGYRQVAKQ